MGRFPPRHIAVRSTLVAAGALAFLAAAAPAPSGSSKRDTTRPTAPRKLVVTASGPTRLSLAWKRSRDNVRVVGYRVSRNGAVAGSTAGTSFTLLGLRCKGRYAISVRALDAAGNASRSASVTGKTKPCPRPTPPPPPPPPPPSPPPPPPSPPPPPPAGCTITLTPVNSISTALASSSGVVCLSAGTYSQAIVYARPLTSYLTLRCLPGAVLTNPTGHTLRVNEPGAFLRVERCRFVGGGVAAGGIVDLYGSHLQIVDNEITGSDDNGIYTDEASDHVSILRNRIHDNGVVRDGNQDHGIYLQGDDQLVANNLIYDEPQGFCIQHYDYGRRAVIANNTFLHCGYARPCCGGIVLGGSGSGPEGVGVRDAVVVNNVVAFNTYYSISHDSSPPASCDVHANLSFGTGMESGGWPGGCVGSNPVGDPLFVNLAGRDLHVVPGSPAIDMGDRARAVSPDFGGTSRPQGARADAGAFER